MWNTPKKWNKYIEKPRLAIFSIFIPTIFCSFYGLHAITFKLSAFNIIMIIGLMILILIISFILIISMDNKRIKVIAPYFEEKINKSSEKQKKHIGVSKTNTIELETLYKELKKYDLIEIDKTSIKDFVNALTNSLRHKESKVFLSKKMDNPSTRLFYELLKDKFEKKSVKSISYFFEESNRIFKHNGNKYLAKSINNAPTRTSSPKMEKELKSIFNEIQ